MCLTTEWHDEPLNQTVLELPIHNHDLKPKHRYLHLYRSFRKPQSTNNKVFYTDLHAYQIPLPILHWLVYIFLFLLGISGNICNIALNTQGVAGETYYGKPIMTSFHGAWSVGGFTGALVGLLVMNFHLTPYLHFCIIATLVWVHIIINYRFLLPDGKHKPRAN